MSGPASAGRTGDAAFSRELFESAGFEVLAFDRDDTGPARVMARLLGWEEQMDLDADLFARYTLLRKRTVSTSP